MAAAEVDLVPSKTEGTAKMLETVQTVLKPPAANLRSAPEAQQEGVPT